MSSAGGMLVFLAKLLNQLSISYSCLGFSALYTIRHPFAFFWIAGHVDSYLFVFFFFKQNFTNLTEQNMYSISFFIFSKSKRICIFHFSTLSHQKLNRNSKQKYKHWALKFVTFLWLKYFMLLAVFVTIPELDCSCFLSWSIFVDRCFFVEFYDT